MGIEPTSPGHPGVLSQLNYGNIRESTPILGADHGRGFVAVPGRVRWASGVIERRHSMPGIEPGPPRLSPRTVRPPMVEDNRSTSAHRNWGDQPDSHRHKRLHGA